LGAVQAAQASVADVRCALGDCQTFGEQRGWQWSDWPESSAGIDPGVVDTLISNGEQARDRVRRDVELDAPVVADIQVFLDHELVQHIGECRQRDLLAGAVQVDVETATVRGVGRGLEHPGFLQRSRLTEFLVGHDAAPRVEAWIDQGADGGLVVQVADELPGFDHAFVGAQRGRLRVFH
jgi:hypothetical protein